MYVSRDSGGREIVCAGRVMMKLSGFCGCVHGASRRCYGVAFFRFRSVYLLLIRLLVGVICNFVVIGFVRVVALGWSLARGFIHAFIFRLLR